MQYKAAVSYYKGWYILLMANVLFLMDQPSASVWLSLNAVGVGLVLYGRHLDRKGNSIIPPSP